MLMFDRYVRISEPSGTKRLIKVQRRSMSFVKFNPETNRVSSCPINPIKSYIFGIVL